MPLRTPAPRMELVPDPHEAKRVRLTLSCTDVDHLPKVTGAGEIFEKDGVSVQRMHNGVLIQEGCYGGQWMTEIIRSSHGHHEPQEELIFDTVVKRLASEKAPTMIEFGSFWTYYGIWFATALPKARVIAMEPDPHNMEVGKFNASLNGVTDRIDFIRGAIGADPGNTFTFTAESDDQPYLVEQQDLDSLMAKTGLEHVDLILVDVQGAETVLLERGVDSLKAGRVRYLIVSTHHNSISGSALTHQNALALLKNAGAHIIAEHSVPESFSGDGLIAASFDERDKDLTVPISYARAKDSLFDELEYELDVAQRRAAAASYERDLVMQSSFWKLTKPARAATDAARKLLGRGESPEAATA